MSSTFVRLGRSEKLASDTSSSINRRFTGANARNDTPISSNVESIDPTNDAGGQRWDAFLSAHEDATVFHSAAWARVLVDTYEYVPLYFRILGGKGTELLLPCMEIKSAWGKVRGVLLPFTDFCDVPGESQDAYDIVSALLDFAKARHWNSIEVRAKCVDNSHGYESYYRHQLSLKPGLDILFAKCAGVIRTNIRKAEKVGVRIEVLQSLDAVKDYYRLHGLTRKRHGIPPQPFAFFKNIHTHLIEKGKGFVVLAYFNERVIAGAVYLGFGANAVFKFGASDYRYQHLRASSAVMWRAIRHLREQGYAALCFGRTDLDADGLRRFKSHWGTTEQTIAYHKYDVQRGVFDIARNSKLRVTRQVLRHVPVPVLRAMGAALYRYWG